ncbi:hypothetical protein EV360DRAFT_72038 [Lentinula raphanica]|nr:hypothetical protein EV360DRAFT_72038 [Lentinula raphanica]
MHYSQLLKVLLSTAFTLHVAVTGSPIPSSEPVSSVLGKRNTINLYHVTSATSAASIQHDGVSFNKVKQSAGNRGVGEDFNPKGTDGFYVSDNREGIIEWCKKRNLSGAKVNCAKLVTFTFDESAAKANLKQHPFHVPTASSLMEWMDTDEYTHYDEFVRLCLYGDKSETLNPELADGGKTLDLITGSVQPIMDTYEVRQYAFRTKKALDLLRFKWLCDYGLTF